MKRNTKRFLALFLSVTLAVSPAVSAFAETSDAAVQSDSIVIGDEPDTEADINATEEADAAKPVAADNENTKADPAAGTDAAGNGEEGEEENSILESQEDAESEDNSEPIEENDDKALPDSVQIGDTTYDDGDYNIGIASDFSMFRIVKSTAKVNGDNVTVSISTEKETYNKIYIGSKDDETKEPVIEGVNNSLGGYTFTFELPVSQMGKTVTFVPCNTKTGAWYVKKDIFLTIPDKLDKQDVAIPTPTPVPTETPVPTATPLPAPEDYADGDYNIALESDAATLMVDEGTMATVKGDQIVIKLVTRSISYDRLYLGMLTDAVKSPLYIRYPYTEDPQAINWGYYIFSVPKSALGTRIPFVLYSTTKEKWSTKQYYFNIPASLDAVEPNPTPSPVPAPEVVADGDYKVEVVSSASMFRVVDCVLTSENGKMRAVITLSGTGYDKLYMGTAAEAEKANESDMISFAEDADGRYTYTVPVSELDMEIPVAAHSRKNGTWYDRTLTFKSEGMEKINTAVDIPADGDYRVEVESSASMFRVVDCVLTSEHGKLSAVITLSGTGYDKLYMGTAAEAEKASESDMISFTQDADGRYTYSVPVSGLDTEIPVAAHSRKNGTWYDRTLTFKSEGMEKIGGGSDAETPGGNTPGGNTPEGNIPGGNTPDGNTPGNATGDPESEHASDQSGSTGRVDSSTTLADGVYTPDKFSWSGGTGRVGLSCNKITITNGKAYATIVFSSNSYTYVKANGNVYFGSHGANTSSFVIPVELNKNNRIIGMTTKMSASHEITYTIFVYLAAAEGANGNAGQSGNLTLDEEAPEIVGLEYKEETKLDYAKYFKIYHYDQGITLLEIDLTTDTAREAAKKLAESTTDDKDKAAEALVEGETAPETEDSAALYEGNIVKYLIVPENTEIPAGLDKEMIVVQLPKEKAYVASEAVLEMMDKLLATEKIAAVGCEKEDCKIESVIKAMEEEKTVFAGKFDEPDYRKLLDTECNLTILPAEILPQDSGDDFDTLTIEEQTERLKEITERHALLKIPMIVDRSTDEEDELAQYEWIKVYGVLFGNEEKAAELFDAAVAAKTK